MNKPIILDGKAYSSEINENTKKRVQEVIKVKNIVPTLATVLVGNNSASLMYVKMKAAACYSVGINFIQIKLPENSTTEAVQDEIRKLNKDASIHGILLQHPVPRQIDESACFNIISPEKDVDGVSYDSFAKVSMGKMCFAPATPLGIIKLLKKYNISFSGKEAVVVGRSAILGKPIAAMLLNEDCTITICHSKTHDLGTIVKRADIVIAGIGKPKFIKVEWIKDGATVVDAGYNEGSIGDTDLENIKKVVRAYTPVPGGVGPMTIAILLEQTVLAAEIKKV